MYYFQSGRVVMRGGGVHVDAFLGARELGRGRDLVERELGVLARVQHETVRELRVAQTHALLIWSTYRLGVPTLSYMRYESFRS